jgi:prepilin signal peptidase PulO-like enzyme (type II secretory pathway)
MSTSLVIPIFLGWAAGLIVNHLADVLPITRRPSQPACLQCNTPFTLKEYLLFAPCKNGHTRTARAWITQFLAAAILIFSWFQPSPKLGFWLGLPIILYFGIVFVIDMEHRLILHPTSIVGALLGLGVGLVTNGLMPTLLGGLGGFAIMLVFYYFGVLFSRIRARRMRARGQEADDEEALGAGDVILAAILGFMLGWPLIWFGLLLGILLGGIFGVFLVLFMLVVKKYKDNVLMVFMPYGPFFILSAFLILFLPGFIGAIVPK